MDATEQPAANNVMSRIFNVAVGVFIAAAVALARCFLTEPVVAQMGGIVAYLDAHQS